MKTLNRENYNEVMFELLENEIRGEEREDLLRQINSDPFYKSEWEFWQQSTAQESAAAPVAGADEFLESLLVKPEKRVIMPARKWLVAASLLLLFSIALVLMRNTGIESQQNLAVNSDSSEKQLSGKDKGSVKKQDLNKPVVTDTQILIGEQDRKPNPSKLIRNKRTFIVPGPEERREIPVRDKSKTDSSDQNKTEEAANQTLIASATDSSQQNQLSIVSIETGKVQPAQNESKISLTGLLTNTKIRFRKVKNKPAITVQGEESTLVISLHQ